MVNKLFWAIIIAGVAAQLAKILIFVFKHKQNFHWKDLIVTGGMPSSHSALVSSLVVGIYIDQGVSALFVVALVFSLVVLRDAFGVRRTAGEEGKLINKIIEKSKLKLKEKHFAMGHTPKEVTVGIIIGVVSAILVYMYI